MLHTFICFGLRLLTISPPMWVAPHTLQFIDNALGCSLGLIPLPSRTQVGPISLLPCRVTLPFGIGRGGFTCCNMQNILLNDWFCVGVPLRATVYYAAFQYLTIPYHATPYCLIVYRGNAPGVLCSTIIPCSFFGVNLSHLTLQQQRTGACA